MLKLTPGKALDLLADIDAALDSTGFLTPDGHFIHPVPVSVAVDAAEAVKEVFIKYGLQVPDRVDRILHALELIPTILLIAGVN